MIVLFFDDYNLSHNPHHFAYMPTFDTAECQQEKKMNVCCYNRLPHTTRSLGAGRPKTSDEAILSSLLVIQVRLHSLTIHGHLRT